MHVPRQNHIVSDYAQKNRHAFHQPSISEIPTVTPKLDKKWD